VSRLITYAGNNLEVSEKAGERRARGVGEQASGVSGSERRKEA
jgi:hypothetical protein